MVGWLLVSCLIIVFLSLTPIIAGLFFDLDSESTGDADLDEGP